MDASLPGKFYILNMSTEGLVKEHVNVFHKMYLNRIRPFIAFFFPVFIGFAAVMMDKQLTQIGSN